MGKAADEPDELPGTVAIGASRVAATAPALPADWRYAIQVEIAQGGMGRVVEATDNVLGRTVALKQALSLDPDTIRRFQREIRITARLEHPSIVPVHDAGTSPDGSPFYVMRKISGRPLEELVSRGGQLRDRLALVPHVVAAAHAIAHAHGRGIVHRDIKPANILVGDTGETIVIDWGLAKAIGEVDEPTAAVAVADDSLKTRAGIVFGTPGFIAPELLRGKPADERSDVYALGATLYHVLARRPPHYSKDHAAIAKAAGEGPAAPLRSIVEGVPPELATIVEKALAFDAANRYPDARALAEDLQRFLTGQLVASHYYTPRERFVRFLRKHRATVSIAAVSAFALVLVAFVLVQQIRHERDRADAQRVIAVHQQQVAERERATAVASSLELALGNAQHAASDDPTRAVALAKPLAGSELWRAARDVGAAASNNGVAFSLVASPHTRSLELSRDGQRALAAGDDGLVRIHDLAKRVGRVVANEGGPVMARFADGERKIVLFAGSRLSIVDAASGARRDVTAPSAIAKLEVSGPIAFWVDADGALWKLDLATVTPARVDVAEPVSAVSPSPDGRWIALAGKRHLLVVDRSSGALPPEVIADGEAKALTWSPDGAHLVALLPIEIVDVSMAPAPHIFRRLLVGELANVAYSEGRIYSSGPTGVELQLKDGTKLRASGDHSLGVFAARDRSVIAANAQGEILVLSDLGDRALRTPHLPIEHVATSPAGPWIVAACAGRLLVWSLDATLPRLVATGEPSSARFVTGDHLIVTYADDNAAWIDLRTSKSVPLGTLSAIAAVATSPDGAEAIVIDGQRRARRVAGVGQPQELDGEVTAAAYIDNTRLALAVPGGLRIDDALHSTKLLLYAHDAEARGLATHGDWVVGAFADGVLWRKQLATSQTAELRVPPITGRVPIAIADDGTIVLGIAGEVRTWTPEGTSTTIAKSGAVRALTIDGTTAIALADDGAITIDLARGVASPPLAIGKIASLASAGLVAAQTASAGVEVVDPVVGWRWPLGVVQKGLAYQFVDIAPDGSRVVATTNGSVVVWTIALPRTAEQTRHWLDEITNATAASPSGPLGWE